MQQSSQLPKASGVSKAKTSVTIQSSCTTYTNNNPQKPSKTTTPVNMINIESVEEMFILNVKFQQHLKRVEK